MRLKILTSNNLESSFSFTGLTDEESTDVTAGRSVPLDDWLPHDWFRYGQFYSSCITEVVDQYCCLAMWFDRFDINGVLDFFFSTDNWNRFSILSQDKSSPTASKTESSIESCRSGPVKFLSVSEHTGHILCAHGIPLFKSPGTTHIWTCSHTQTIGSPKWLPDLLIISYQGTIFTVK